jgi:hypothetical protein
MADNNEQPVAEKETNQVPKVQIGQESSKKFWRRLKVPKPNKKGFLLALLILIILIAGGLFIKKSFHIGEKVYAQAAGHKIYKEDIDKLRGNVKGVSDHDVATVLADKYLYEAMAKQGDIQVSDQDVATQHPDANKQKNSNKYVYQGDVNITYQDKLIAYNTGLYKGKVLVAHFSRHIAFQSPYIDIQRITNPLLGNKTAIAKDKKYAHDFITKLYKQVKDNKISFDQAIQIEHKDPVVGENGYQTESHSGSFDTSNIFLGGTALIGPKSIQHKLASMKAGQLSEPFTVTVPNAWKDPKITTESYYLVVRMDYTKGSHSGLSWKDYLAQAKKKYSYKVFI